jgi:cell wall-associated NlpC family hydrolase
MIYFKIEESALFYIHEPVVNMRENPTLQSRVVSQALFSEKITIEKREGEWSYILTSDGYPGWIQSEEIVKLTQPFKPSLKISRLKAHIYEQKDIEYGPFKTLPYGSHLQALDTTDARWITVAFPNGKEYYIQKGDIASEKPLQGKSDLVTFSQRFLGLPYTWGGRSSFGYDCSGFVQMLYQQIGILLPRDSHQQVRDACFQTIPLEHLQSGDLIFFGKSNQKIMHVGMSLGNKQFIHATSRENQPWIRVSDLSDFEWSGHQEAYYPYCLARKLIIKS